MKFWWLALYVLELEGRSGPLRNFRPFSKVCAFGMYYEACKLLIADIKCITRTSFLPSFIFLGDQGDPVGPNWFWEEIKATFYIFCCHYIIYASYVFSHSGQTSYYMSIMNLRLQSFHPIEVVFNCCRFSSSFWSMRKATLPGV